MQVIPIQAIPNQAFSITLDQNLYDITLRAAAGIVAATIKRNAVLIIENTRALAIRPIIPYKYLEDGNFFFITANGDLPVYTSFNTTQQLIYISQAELDAIRALPKPLFNPLGSLPLRYKPQGYVAAP